MGMIGRVVVVSVAAVLSLWAIYEWAWEPHRCSIEVTRLVRRTNSARNTASDYDRTVRARQNAADLAELQEHCATDVRIPVLAAENLRFLGRTEEAVRSYEEALRREPRPEIAGALGDTLVELGRIDEAADRYAEAVRFGSDPAEVVPYEELQRMVRERLRGGR